MRNKINIFYADALLQNILKGCQRNDRLSQEKLYQQFYPGLFALCKKLFDNNDDIITSLNNGMMNVYKNINAYNPDKGELFSWAYSIVRNASLTYLRDKINAEKKLGIQVNMTDEMEYEQPFTSPFKQLEWKDIYFYLEKLPPASRAVCTLYYIEAYPIKEIATQLNLSTGTIKWHLNESRNKLKSLFTKNYIS